jgi:hypothetical protein
MIIDRRTFITRGMTLLVTVPALGALPRWLSTLPPRMTGAGAGENLLVFKIDGWDNKDGEASNGDEVWIRINPSWRVAWR